MDEADKPCTEKSATAIPTVSQTTAKKIGQCKTETATAEIDTRELIYKETGCGDHAELTDVCNNTDVLENEWNKVTLQEDVEEDKDVDTETKEKIKIQINTESDEIEETSNVNASASEIDLTKEGAAEIAAVNASASEIDLTKEGAAEIAAVNASNSEIDLTKEGAAKIAAVNASTSEIDLTKEGAAEIAAVNASTSETDLTKEDAAEIAAVNASTSEIDLTKEDAAEIAAVNASTSEIDLTKEGAAEIADVENSSTPKNAWITDGGKAVKLAPANKELMSVMAATLKMSHSSAKESDDKAVHSVFEKLLSAVTDRVDNNKKILNTSENILKKKDDEKAIILDQQKSLLSTPTSDHRAKTASKFTCIGPAQLVARKVVSHAKSGSSTAPSSSEFKQTKRTEKFIVKNVGKVSKMYKVSNLSYKIKPVRKNLGSNPTYPVIYVGEPAFMKDFFETGREGSINVVTPPTEIKEEDLYDISKLQNAFTPTENRSVSNTTTTPSIGKSYPYLNMPHPSLNSRPRFLPPCPDLNQLFQPSTSFSYPGISNFNPGEVIRIVARTIPSATMASYTTTSTSGSKLFSLSTQKQTYQAFNPIPLTTVGGFPSQTHKTRPVIFKTHVAPSSVAQQHTGQAPVTKILSPQIKVIRNTSAVKRGVMTVNLVPGTNTANTETMKIRQPVQFLPSSSVLSKLATNSLTVTTGKMKTPASLVIIPSKNNAKVCPVVQGSTTGKFSNNLAKITSTEHKISISMPKPVARIVGNFQAECGPNAHKQLSTVNSTVTTSSKSLREGVEVMFEDGVRHFITSLRQMTHQDDEPIKSWSELKKGAEVAAKWIDGQIYDATIVACYFSIEKKLQPVGQLEKIAEKSQKITPKVQKRKDNDSPIRCTVCRNVFKSLVPFRKHLKTTCKRPDIIVHKSAMVVTDGSVEAVGKGESSASRKKIESPPSETKKSDKHSRKRVMKEPVIDEKPLLKKRKVTPIEKSVVVNKADNDDAIFKTGTKFLHRWQLDDGTSKWYQGEVIRIVSKDKAFLDREFEVSYKGESEDYVLKLYEDYPADIRIMGRT